jgi:transaldolase
MDELASNSVTVEQKLNAQDIKETTTDEAPLTETQWRWLMNDDAMATEKLSEGIRNFAIDQVKLEKQLSEML